jgi:DNA-binding FadR family transcriptional regulator
LTGSATDQPTDGARNAYTLARMPTTPRRPVRRVPITDGAKGPETAKGGASLGNGASGVDREDVSLAPRRLKLSERLARHIASELLAQRPDVGTPLPDEKHMADRYGVARSTLREALRLLETWGVLTIKTGRTGGPVVTRPTPSDLGLHLGVVMQAASATLGDVLDAREMLDALMARRAARLITDAQLEDLAVTLQAMKESLSSPQAFWDATARFYEVLVNASQNRALAVLSGSLRTITTQVLHVMPYSEEWRTESLTLRRALLRALAAGDEDEAERRMLAFRTASRAYYRDIDPEVFDRTIDVLTADLQDDSTMAELQDGTL